MRIRGNVLEQVMSPVTIEGKPLYPLSLDTFHLNSSFENVIKIWQGQEAVLQFMEEYKTEPEPGTGMHSDQYLDVTGFPLIRDRSMCIE